MRNAIIEHIFAALRLAGPKGLTAREIADAVTQSYGRPTSRERVLGTMAQWRTAAKPGPQLHFTTVGKQKLWTLAGGNDEPTSLPLPAIQVPTPVRRDLAWPKSLTAALMGDPLPGRSAHDQRQNR